MFKRSTISIVLLVTFIIVTITGIFLFFRIKPPGFTPIHEWLGMVFVVYSIFHFIKNFKPFKSYLQKKEGIKWLLVSTILSLGLFAYFAISSMQAGVNPKRILVQKIYDQPIKVVAPVYGYECEDIINKFIENKYNDIRCDYSIKDIAKNNQIDTTKVVSIMLL